GVRLEVRDGSPEHPVPAAATADSMTGRGLRMVASIAARWGVDHSGEGKVVWAELVPGRVPQVPSPEELLALWDDAPWAEGGGTAGDDGQHVRVALGDVPTDLLVAAKTHVDNLVREFTLVLGGADHGARAPIPPHLAALIDTVVTRFADARHAIKRQAV